MEASMATLQRKEDGSLSGLPEEDNMSFATVKLLEEKAKDNGHDIKLEPVQHGTDLDQFQKKRVSFPMKPLRHYFPTITPVTEQEP